jgi:hypothetical protein
VGFSGFAHGTAQPPPASSLRTRPPTSDLRPPTSVLCPLSSVLRPPSSFQGSASFCHTSYANLFRVRVKIGISESGGGVNEPQRGSIPQPRDQVPFCAPCASSRLKFCPQIQSQNSKSENRTPPLTLRPPVQPEWNKTERFGSRAERALVPHNQNQDPHNRLCLVAFGCVWLPLVTPAASLTSTPAQATSPNRQASHLPETQYPSRAIKVRQASQKTAPSSLDVKALLPPRPGAYSDLDISCPLFTVRAPVQNVFSPAAPFVSFVIFCEASEPEWNETERFRSKMERHLVPLSASSHTSDASYLSDTLVLGLGSFHRNHLQILGIQSHSKLLKARKSFPLTSSENLPVKPCLPTLSGTFIGNSRSPAQQPSRQFSRRNTGAVVSLQPFPAPQRSVPISVLICDISCQKVRPDFQVLTGSNTF